MSLSSAAWRIKLMNIEKHKLWGWPVRRFRQVFFSSSWRGNTLTKTAIRRLLGTEQPLLILEVGAADGLDTLELASCLAGLEFHIYAFEPEPRNVEQFRGNVGAHDRITLVPSALGELDGFSDFHVSSTPYSSSLKEPILTEFSARWPSIRFDEIIKIQVRSLDSWVTENQVAEIDFIWADVQGAEDLLVLGAQKTLDTVRYFYTEYDTFSSPIYNGGKDLASIAKLLGPNWTLMRDYGTDALFRNDALPSQKLR